uniref:Uncharacterized protein n=1 Tax=Setaria italica TaxID=4555 RepID=K3XS38_SETIT
MRQAIGRGVWSSHQSDGNLVLQPGLQVARCYPAAGMIYHLEGFLVAMSNCVVSITELW